MTMHSCGCCSLKAGCRLGAIWTMFEAVVGIALLVASGLLGHGNILSIVATCFFVVVFCAAWVLLTGIFRENITILYVWSFLYLIFVLIRVTLLGFMVAAYAQYSFGKPVTFEIIYLSDGTALSETSETPSSVDTYMPYLLGAVCGLGASIIISAWILIGVIYLAVQIRRQLWKRARLEHDEM